MTDQITIEQLRETLTFWAILFGSPRTLPQGSDARRKEAWEAAYLIACNSKRSIRRFWQEIRIKMLTESVFFPTPAEVLKVADGLAANYTEGSMEPQRRIEIPDNAATAEEVREIVARFRSHEAKPLTPEEQAVKDARHY